MGYSTNVNAASTRLSTRQRGLNTGMLYNSEWGSEWDYLRNTGVVSTVPSASPGVP